MCVSRCRFVCVCVRAYVQVNIFVCVCVCVCEGGLDCKRRQHEKATWDLGQLFVCLPLGTAVEGRDVGRDGGRKEKRGMKGRGRGREIIQSGVKGQHRLTINNSQKHPEHEAQSDGRSEG